MYCIKIETITSNFPHITIEADICRYLPRSNGHKTLKFAELQDLGEFGLSEMQNGDKFGVL